jgi:hypothetical protein
MKAARPRRLRVKSSGGIRVQSQYPAHPAWFLPFSRGDTARETPAALAGKPAMRKILQLPVSAASVGMTVITDPVRGSSSPFALKMKAQKLQLRYRG